MTPEEQEQEDKRLSMDALVLASLLRSAADALQAGAAQGMYYVQFNPAITFRNFMRFTLGRDMIGNPKEADDERPI